jgi:hypothetical protein
VTVEEIQNLSGTLRMVTTRSRRSSLYKAVIQCLASSAVSRHGREGFASTLAAVGCNGCEPRPLRSFYLWMNRERYASLAMIEHAVPDITESCRTDVMPRMSRVTVKCLPYFCGRHKLLHDLPRVPQSIKLAKIAAFSLEE